MLNTILTKQIKFLKKHKLIFIVLFALIYFLGFQGVGALISAVFYFLLEIIAFFASLTILFYSFMYLKDGGENIYYISLSILSSIVILSCAFIIISNLK
ncbi:hypothetical protein [Fusobacterium sp. MFO224]|uniref:hypothetical protein n=1 Tax=Fusobacterium sp. MFO224 TaxID=3378070 RepID=UPI003853B738